jgi:hypothetical protein
MSALVIKPIEERIVSKLMPLVVRIDTLRPHPKNPNVGRTDLMVESLNENKQFKPIVYCRSNIILAGNHTYFAAMELGWPDIAAVYVDVDWDSEEGKRITLADNEIGRRSTTEDGLLAEMLTSMDRPTIGTGVDDELLGKILERIDQPLNFGEGVEEPKEPVTFDIFSQEAVLDDAFRHYRAAGFPAFKKTRFAMMQEINKLASLDVDQLANSSVAHHVADCYHMHRWTTHVSEKKTALEQFARDDELQYALKLCTDLNHMITNESLLNVLAYVHGAQVAANFRPGFALSLVKRFCPDDGVWLDTSAGYGGRLVAFMASKRKHYIGIDPSEMSVRGNEQMVIDLGFRDRVTLIQEPAEDVKLNDGFCDFAFTSPPYFAKERYSDEPTQSWKRYATGESWRAGFLLPTLALQFRALRAQSFAVMNIADVKLRGETFPLVEWARQCAREVGFEYVTEEKFPLGRVPGQGEAQQRFEPVLIWKKP